jgi:hypothetical protein
MSGDVEQFFIKPANLFWTPSRTNDPLQQYRELDAPLTRYLIGIGRLTSGGIAPLPVDWDWSQPWHDNLEAGAHPDQ